MSKLRLNINGQEVTGFQGQTILDIARENGIKIPTLCHDERVELYASCGICTVEVEGNPRLLRACSTMAVDGMIVHTETERVRRNRQTALELILSNHVGDCRPPCVLECPAQTDCQGYVGLVANGEYSEALKLVKDKIPLPSSIGRVCPHPCENACRRELVEEPIAIAAIKQFLGDYDLAQDALFTHDIAPSTGKHVVIIGGGPGGLSAAYFLRRMGHTVDIYDAMPEMGGMLRYGIPEYRLPKKVLDAEISAIEKMGVGMWNNSKIGKDLTLDYLRSISDAVIVAIGAWQSAPLRCPGEDLEGVIGGIDFLRDVALAKPMFTGRKVAIVGGGNTAMDACRTAVRLGASEVYNIYRRTRNEMPAEAIEIDEAEEEGVIFKSLTNPIEVVGENGKVKAVRLQVMELGEPDASGRRAPVAVEGKEETLDVDTVIVAIGQKTEASGFEQLTQTRWNTLVADETTFLTGVDGVFAIGDATNDGADIAITAIGEAKKAAAMVDKFLNGEVLTTNPQFLVKSEKLAEDFADIPAAPRAKIAHRSPVERRNDFLSVNKPLCENTMKTEAARCLECGCYDYFECKLLEYANEYDVKPDKYGQKEIQHGLPKKESHPYIKFDDDKCILCGLCVRICDEVVGATALGLVERGVDTVVRPALMNPLIETDCISCGMCATVCPTGTITERLMIAKQVPLKEDATQTVCGGCSVGCQSRLMTSGNLITRNLPADENALLCAGGRFGFGRITENPRLTTPLVNGQETTYEEAIVFANKKLHGIQTQYGADSIAVSISGRYTNEEAAKIIHYAQNVLKTPHIFSFENKRSGLEEILGVDASTATFEEMENTELIVAVSPKSMIENHAVVAMRIRRAVNNGAKLLLISTEDSLLDNIAALRVGSIHSGRADEMIKNARKVVFVFEKNAVSTQDAAAIANIAAAHGHQDSPRNGIIQLLPRANSQGIINLGVKPGEAYAEAIANGKIRGLFIFGEGAPDVDLEKLDVLCVQDIHLTDIVKKAQVVFPASHFAESSGTYTSADGKVQTLNQAVKCQIRWDNLQLLNALSC